MRKLIYNMPLNLMIFVLFNTLLSLISLPITFIALALAIIVTAFYAQRSKNTTLIRAIAYGLVFIGLALIWQSLEIPSLIALTAVLMLLSWAKVCEIKSTRDHNVIWLISTVLLAINILLLSQYQLIIALVGITLLLLSATAINQALPAKINTQKNKLAAKRLALLTLTSLPFALILFVTLPRINLPMQELGLAMGLPIAVQPQENIAGKGLGRELGFNDISEKAQSDSRVLLATLPTDFTMTEDKPLYWRGPVYWQYSVTQKVNSTVENKLESKVQGEVGNNAQTNTFEEKWLLREGFNTRSKRQYNGFGSNKAIANMASKREDTLEYSVILMPHGEYWLYGLDLPANLTGESYLSQDYQLLSIRTVDTMWRYKIKSSLTYQISEKEPQAQIDLGLQYPSNNPQIKALGQQWAQQFSNTQHASTAIINHAEQFFKQGKFLYANTGEQLQGQHQLDQFLFSKKVGYSQHYASALTLLLRAANIPARLVAGYRGAEKVGLTNLYTVNESHAHAWVEAYYTNPQGEKSWQRIDPALWLSDLFSSAQESNADQNATQELSAQQIAEQKAKPSIASEQAQKQIVKKGKGKANESSTSWLDSLNQWTLDFDANKQTTLASKLGIKHLLWWHLVAIALGLLLLLALTIYLSLRYINRGKKLAPHSQVYHKLCKKLAKKGIIRLPHEGAQSYFARCAVEQSLQAQCFNSLSQHYLQLAYGKLNPQQQKQVLTQFKHLASQI